MNFKFNKPVKIPVGHAILEGELSIPKNAHAIVIFSHGSGSGRFSKRNQAVAKYLNENNIGTLLFDLLTAEEDLHYYNRFDIDLLSKRLVGATEWLEKLPAAANCRIGYFGASTGTAAALKAATLLPNIGGIASRSGRPDLVMDIIARVGVPVLSIVGGEDHEIVKINQKAYQLLPGEKQLEVLAGVTHMFEEKGAIVKVAVLAVDWFEKYLCPAGVLK